MKCPKCGVACIPSVTDATLPWCPVHGAIHVEPKPKRRARIGVDLEVETEPVTERETHVSYGYPDAPVRYETFLTTPAVLLLSAEEIIKQLARAYGFDPAEIHGLTVTVEPPQEGSDQFVFTVQGG